MNANRRNAIWAGVFYIIATIAPISTIFFIGFLGGQIEGRGPVLDYLVNVSANETQVLIGMLIELIYVLAIVGIIVNLFPILRKHNEASALWFFSLRFIEAICAIVGSIILLTLLPLSQEFIKVGVPDASHFQTTGDLLLAARDWTFLIGSGLVWSLSALILNYLLYQSKLIPRWLSVWGFVGAILSLAAYSLQLFGIKPPEIAWIPIGVQEMIFAVWLIAKGINSSAIVSESAE
ncbi:DUF4386 domain-containing protein [Chloroflexota bacterium]